ncbi:UDP-N-acetylmuramate dehydrogenase [Rhodoluna lacicola]|jgi:UDP-N-acetylmuramate dehydrogenase|uniref:UDP-N-acetylenolpyruvoylglucosamine reductase n=1 Tax=Rhodoluna lacicola TaxID=529884 RepID=A0A060JB18_9MICO|nr:UDP-N-acetylmuramate dehydrogenase [Rhodoluna lacicola]AIC47056.1 UDP-N-acetylenolpyruvoylglucosamine reductase [Rhodoluna lacicola]
MATPVTPHPLADLTSMRVGGTPAEIYAAKTRDDLIEHTLNVWRSGDDWLLLGGGTNMVVADNVENLRVIKVENMGIEPVRNKDETRVVVRVQAGENWDDFVAHTVKAGLAGIEAMSGIPGTVGASPVQNIGAYGQELSDSMVRLEFVDYETHEIAILEAKDLQFGYRDSAIKRGRPGVITWVEFELQKLDGLSRPLYSTQIAADLGVAMGAQVSLEAVRASVLKLRARKGMVIDENDPDSVSCGSFFTNPIVSDRVARGLPDDAPKYESEEDDGLTVKLSAAWLIENAGIEKGFRIAGSRAAISSKHTLAIVNTGGATATEILQLAEYVQVRVSNKFGINLVPEPNLIGFI